ncbi:hypothetical protein NXX40_05130 [Parabacteroides distasonis]|nr:hypothetical protein [Parabacteroides distasonis]
MAYKFPVTRNKKSRDFILTELDESALELPETRESVERTRATRYAAYALQSRAALYAASIAKYGKVQLNGIVGVNSDDANAYWAKSIEAADKVINSGKYTLYNRVCGPGGELPEYVSGEKRMFGVYLLERVSGYRSRPFLGFIECAV